MTARNFIILVLLAPVATLAKHHNDSQSIPAVRTFSGFFLTVTDEPIDYLDVLEGSGSGAGYEPKTDQRHHSEKRRYYITKEASQLLTGRLLTVFVPTVYTLVFIISVPLNVLALIMFIRRIRPKKPAVIYILNLVCADLLFVSLLPFRVAYHYNGNNWIYGAVMCRVVTSAFYCNMYCSVLLMMCISVDRFIVVVYPMDSLTWRSPKTASAVCAAMWLLSFGGVAPLLISEQTVYLPDLGITTCHDVLDIQLLRSYYLYFFPVFCSVFFFIPLVFTAVCYARIIQELCAASVENRSKKTRAIYMVATVLIVFVICFTPTNVILLLHYVRFSHTHDNTSYAAYLLSMCVGSVSCCLDPIIYYFGSSQCQKQVLAFLRCKTTATIKRSQLRSSNSSTRSSKLETFKSNVSSQYRKLTA